MSKETKIGLMLVLVLVAAFGFVLWRKWDERRKQIVAGGTVLTPAEQTAGTGTSPDGAATSPAPTRQDGISPPPQQSETVAGAQTEPGPATAGRAQADDFGAEADPFARPSAGPPRGTIVAQPRGAGAPTDPFGDDFGSATAASAPPAQNPPRRTVAAPAGDFGADLDDPFASAPPRATGAPNGNAPGAGSANVSEAPAAPAGPTDAFGQPLDPADPFASPAGQGTAATAASPASQPRVLAQVPVQPMPAQNPPTDPLADDPFQQPVRAADPQAAPLPQDPLARTESNTAGGFTRVEGQPRPLPGTPTRVAQVSSDFDPFGSSGSGPTRTQAERPVPPASDFGPPAGTGATTGSGSSFVPVESFSAESLGQVDVYEVQGGDNYWTISRKAYGTSKYFMALAKANAERIPDPRRMRPGMKVMLPAREVLETRFRDQLPLGTGPGAATGEVQTADTDPPGFFTGTDGRPRYRIGRKDTLTEIAHDHLGRTSRWIQIFEMNRDRLRDPHDLKLGTILVLPADASRVRLVQQASGTR